MSVQWSVTMIIRPRHVHAVARRHRQSVGGTADIWRSCRRRSGGERCERRQCRRGWRRSSEVSEEATSQRLRCGGRQLRWGTDTGRRVTWTAQVTLINKLNQLTWRWTSFLHHSIYIIMHSKQSAASEINIAPNTQLLFNRCQFTTLPPKLVSKNNTHDSILTTVHMVFQKQCI